ncbi:MAG: helix-turn-helix domain-containing protein [Thermoplasmata archaeon]
MELRVRGGPVPHWMQDLGTRWGAGVRLHVCRHTEESPRRLLQLLEVNAAPATLPEITAFLRQRARPDEVSITQLGPHRLLVRLVGPLPALCHSVFEMGAICMSCPFLPSASAPDGEAPEGEWRVLVHRVRDAHPLLASFTTPGNVPASLVRIGSYRGSQDLTARQEMAVGTAFVLGYYDYPRRAQLKDVAKSLGVSRATAMENLRRGMRKLAFQRQSEVGIVRPPPPQRGRPPSPPDRLDAVREETGAESTGR